MVGSLEGHVALVTGGGRGIGRAVALALADRGAAVAVVARSGREIDDAAAEITGAGGKAFAAECDVADPASVTDLVMRVGEELGAVDILVNNAGSNSVFGPLWEIDAEQWWRDVTINLRGSMLCAASVLPSMVQRRRGCIINIASGSAKRPFPYNSSYAASKAAIVRFTDSLAGETAEHGVTVFALNPGTVDTDMCRGLMGSSDGQRWMIDTIDVLPLHFVSAAVPAAAVVFLAKGRAEALTGRWLEADDDFEMLVDRADEIVRDDLLRMRAVR